MNESQNKNITDLAYNYFNGQKINLDGKSIAVAYSSGVDSSVLLAVMMSLKEEHDLNLNLSLIHVNYNLRGSDSINDMLLAKTVAEKHSIPIYIKEVKEGSFSNKNVQINARLERYDFFEVVKKENSIDYILLAHHKDDLLESILYKMCKCSSTEIIKSMRRRIKYFLRPLIDVYKEDILVYAHDNNVEYREDITNAKNIYSRNKIRNIIVPSLTEINTNAKDNIIRFCERVYKETALLRRKVSLAYSSSLFEKNILDTKILYRYKVSVQNKVLIRFLVKNKIEVTEKRILELRKIIESRKQNIKITIDNCILLKKYNYIEIKKPPKSVDKKNVAVLDIESDGVYSFNGININVRKIESLDLSINLKDMSIICLSVDYPLRIRMRENGDYIKSYPNGEKHRIKKLFIDSKMPLDIRNCIPIILKGDVIVGLYMMHYASNRIHYEYSASQNGSILLFEFDI